MPDDDSMLGQGTVDFRNEGRRHAGRGDGQLFTVPAKLGSRQSLILELVRVRGEAKAIDAGLEIHATRRCEHCHFGMNMPCKYAPSEGRQVLEALRKKGLLKRDRHHIYRRAAEPAAISPDEPVDWGGY